jgi:putative effector of murein hydrolase LrgA (UPF0299 family)
MEQDGEMRITEEAVFRWVVIVTIAGATVAAVALLAGSLAGAIWGLVLLLAAARHGYRWVDRKRRES